VSDDIFTVREVLTASGATESAPQKARRQRLKFWAGRKAAFPAVGAWRRITTAWTAPSRARNCHTC